MEKLLYPTKKYTFFSNILGPLSKTDHVFKRILEQIENIYTYVVTFIEPNAIQVEIVSKSTSSKPDYVHLYVKILKILLNKY
jgi:hypothetical protein